MFNNTEFDLPVDMQIIALLQRSGGLWPSAIRCNFESEQFSVLAQFNCAVSYTELWGQEHLVVQFKNKTSCYIELQKLQDGDMVDMIMNLVHIVDGKFTKTKLMDHYYRIGDKLSGVELTDFHGDTKDLTYYFEEFDSVESAIVRHAHNVLTEAVRKSIFTELMIYSQTARYCYRVYVDYGTFTYTFSKNLYLSRGEAEDLANKYIKAGVPRKRVKIMPVPSAYIQELLDAKYMSVHDVLSEEHEMCKVPRKVVYSSHERWHEMDIENCHKLFMTMSKKFENDTADKLLKKYLKQKKISESTANIIKRSVYKVNDEWEL